MIEILTYQDLLAVPSTDRDRAAFVRSMIDNHKKSALYQTAQIADDYDRCMNTTIMQYQKMITDITGRSYVDKTATVHRSRCNFFNIFTTQLNQYLLGNGASWNNPETAKKLGADFDNRLQEAGHAALCGGVAFGFWNLDHLEVLPVLKFAPLYDEENGALASGVYFWQIDTTKPLRAILYELDGYTSFIWQADPTKAPDPAQWQRVAEDCFMQPKTPYKVLTVTSPADGTQILDGENYPSFPIVPLWGNPHHQSELVGKREKIDAYDFILNGFEDDLDNAQLYWIIRGAGGMDDPELLRFLDRLRNVKAAAPADGQDVQAMEINIPYEAREKLLDRLESQFYADAMILNPKDIASGADTATQIRAAYEPQNVKADQFEYCVIDFVQGILAVAGIDDKPTFERSTVVNTQEEVQVLVTAAPYLGKEYVTRRVLKLLGDGDKAEEVLRQIDAEDAERLGGLGED